MRTENTPRPYAPDLPRIDEPVAGWYALRAVKNGVLVPVRLVYGPPLDPDTGETLDRSYRWTATRAGEDVELAAVWPWCHANPISEAQYRHMLDVKAWAVEHSPDSPEANPFRAIDPLTCPLPF